MFLKILGRATKILIFLIIIIIYLEVRGIPRSRELECGLPDGGAFIWRQNYDWSLMGEVLPHVSKELNKTAFNTYFRSNKGEEIGLVAGGPDKINYKDAAIAQHDCVYFGLAQGVPYIFPDGYLFPGEKKIAKSTYIEHFEQDIIANKTVSSDIKAGLQSAGLKEAGGAFIARPPLVTLEYALENSADPQKPIVAVFHYHSNDGGKTWSSLIVPSVPIMFELGKPLLKQCFIARPVRVDGKKVKVSFPSCPVAFANDGK